MGDESELVFACGIRENNGADLKMLLMKWNDPAGEPRLVRLLETGEERAASLARVKPSPPTHAVAA